MSGPAKVKVGISSCLLGNAVRYNGGHKRCRDIIDFFGECFDWVPLCPETECGMPVPREPINLFSNGDRLFLRTVETKRDITAAMEAWCAGKLAELLQSGLYGFIGKSASPSCALYDCDIRDTITGRTIGSGRGFWTERLLDLLPPLPVEDESALVRKDARQDFLERVLAYAGIRT